jgi:gliding motility-associated protein GldM
MSIPKEPRQLMINIMYLVLTAMLALNVSAEIFNAFKIVDKGLEKSNHALEESNNGLPALIRDGAKKKKALEEYAERIDPARDASKAINEELQKIIDHLIDESGNKNGVYDDGDYVYQNGVKTTDLKGKKDKDVTTRYLINDGHGEELKAKLVKYTEDIVGLVDEADKASFKNEIPTIIDDESWKAKMPKSANAKYDWSIFNFSHMPVQAVLPILRKFQNDVISTESSFLGYLANKVGTTTDVVLDKFTVVSAPEKTYVINGETFTTDVFMSASASGESNTGVSIKVNGTPVAVNSDGVAQFSAKASGVGKKSYNVEASITNPVTGEVQSFTKTYEYEVGERSAAISASKMNVFYIGVDNPVEVSVAGVPSNQVQVSMSGGGGNIKKNSDGTYNVTVTTPTSGNEAAKITLTAPGFTASKDFRVKRIPDPVPMLSKVRGGKMGSGTFKAQGGVLPALEGFDFDAKCDISGFNLVRVPNRQDPEQALNPGGRYGADAQRLIDKAIPGDRYFFDNIKCKCPGDPAPRDLGTMAFIIN